MVGVQWLEEEIRKGWSEDGIEVESTSLQSNSLRCSLPAHIEGIHELILFLHSCGAVVDIETRVNEGAAEIVLVVFVDGNDEKQSGDLTFLSANKPTLWENIQFFLTALLYVIVILLASTSAMNMVIPNVAKTTVSFIHNMSAPS